MPELPEVETIKRGLAKKIKGKTIKKIDIKLPKLVNFDVVGFQKEILGAKIEKISRRAKLLVLKLSNAGAILIHLKMSGQLLYEGEIRKHARAVFYFSDGTKLVFNDMRKFGYFKFLPQNKLNQFFEDKFGPEPLLSEFNLDKFNMIIKQKPNSRIKNFLLDQKNIAGIGNIYADEALFEAKITPTRRVRTLNKNEIKKLHKAIKNVLNNAIKHKGTSFQLYRDSAGKKGKFVRLLKVYQREGKKCYFCSGTVKRIKLGSRSAYFCPKCQK